jgi:hypothetical protein
MGWLGLRRGRAPGLAVLATVLLWLLAGVAEPVGATGTTIRNVGATNVSDTSFTVHWITSAPLPGSGSVLYGTSRDASAVSAQTREQPTVSGATGDVHQAVITNLVPSTTYYFAINVAGTIDNNGGQYYPVQLGPTLTGTTPSRTAAGQVLQSNHQPAIGALVTLTILDTAGLNGSQATTSGVVAGLTDPLGNWRIALNPRTQDASALFKYTTSDLLEVSVDGGALGQFANTSHPLSFDASGNMTVSSVTLGQLTPTETATGSVTATLTPSSTSTPLSTVATSATPTPSLSPTPSPTFTPIPPSEPNPGPAPPVVPTVAPNAGVAPPAAAQPVAVPQLPPANSSATPASAPELVASPVSTVAAAPPATAVAASPIPTSAIVSTALASLANWNEDHTPTAATTPRPTIATSSIGTPTGVGTPLATASPEPPGPLGGLLALIGGSIGLLGLGVTLLVVGLVHQSRGGA